MSHRPLSLLLVLALIAPSALAAEKEPPKATTTNVAPKKDPKKDSITDPADAGIDFTIQGEYEGNFGDAKMGAHIVALGDNKFDLIVYHGGLPGAGWKKGDKRERAKGELKEGVLTFTGDAQPTLKDGVLKFDRGSLQKVERKSPTLGAEPPKGALVLFDGKEFNHFNPGTKTSDGFLKHGQTSKHQFTKSFTLHLEFRLCYEPKNRGQGRSNSGVYLSGGSEVQVLDSFGLEGKNNECGGFYSKREPDVNMCFPPLSWQTYDIEVKVPTKDENGNKTVATVRHNGVVIHENVPIDFKNGGNLHFQDHGNPVAYRNVWIVEK